MNSPPPTAEPIIVIDDDETMRRACQAALQRAGHVVETYPDGPSGLRRIEEVRANLIIVDLKMPGMGGFEVIERVKQLDPDAVVVVITGFATVSTAVEAMKAGAYDFIPKPFTAEELRVIIGRALERRRLVRETKRLREEKDAQARKFVTFVSHQLQSPLGAVQQYLDVLCHQAKESLPEAQRQWIDRARQKIMDMREIIKDWLTFAKVESGQLATQRQPVRWQEWSAPVIDTLAAAAWEGEVSVQDELPAELPPVLGDAVALRMVLANLVSNAIKYNRAGGTVRITGTAGPDTVNVAVHDTGMGIQPEDADKVFEEFFRITDAAHAGKPGTGMGLPICKKIVEELGGRIMLESTPGSGSTFTVVLPRADAPT